VKKWNKEKESSWEIENIREERKEFKRKLKGNTNSEEKV
jgi:hypothetical protein